MATNGKPTVISTFAGTGGSSLGYKWAGFEELLAVDFDSHAVECFKLNFPEVPVWHKSVTDITGKEIMDFCNIKRGELDVFDGSPPCQGFSTAGKRNVTDSRNDLFNHYCRLVTELQPKVFVMENVTGMVKGKFKGKFIEIMQTLKSMNYNVKCKQMNSKYYGVPQSRERLIFIGVRKDLDKQPQYPRPINKITTVRDAIYKIKDKENRLKPNDTALKLVKKVKQGESASKYHSKGNYFGINRLKWDKPSPTVIKNVSTSGSMLIHPEKDEIISLREVKILCSFPENWKLPGSFSDGWARLGNAVMPKFMQAIAETIKTEILEL